MRIWDLQRRVVDVQLRGHRNNIRSLAFHPTGLLLSDGDATIKVWDHRALSVRGGAVVDIVAAATLEGLTCSVTALVILPDRRVLCGCYDGKLRVWQ